MTIIRDLKSVGALVRARRVKADIGTARDTEHEDTGVKHDVEYIKHHSRQTDDEMVRMDKLTWKFYDLYSQRLNLSGN